MSVGFEWVQVLVSGLTVNDGEKINRDDSSRRLLTSSLTLSGMMECYLKTLSSWFSQLI